MSRFEPINNKEYDNRYRNITVFTLSSLGNRAEIMAGLMKAPSDSTMKRLLSAAVKEGNIEKAGRGPATKYKLTPQAHVTMPLDLATYFDKDIDEREVQESFNFDLIRDVLPKVEIFTKEELEVLNAAQMEFKKILKV